MRYRIRIDRPALRDMRRLPHSVRPRIEQAIRALADEPRPQGARAMRGGLGLLRIRVGDYRIIYEVRDAEIVIVIIGVGHRREVYEDTERR